MKLTYLSLILLLISFSCSDAPKETSTLEQATQKESFELVPLKWAKNFRIKKYQSHQVVELLNNGKIYQTFTISSSKTPVNGNTTHFKTPISNIASASCVYTKIFDELGVLNTIKGIDQLTFQYSSNVVDYVNSNNILEFHSGEGLKTEELFVLNPQVLFTWSSNQSNQQIKKLIKLGIPVIFASSYLENHPLARAEWIKFFSLFVDKLDEANAYFETIESKYLDLKKTQSSRQKLILLNAPYSGQWYLPTGHSYMGNLLKDSNFKLFLQDSTSTGAQAFTFEDVIAHHQNAEFWINPSFYESRSQILETDSRYNQLNAFNTNRVYNAIKRKRINGGNDYWEQGVIRPDLILKDLIHIYNEDHTDSLYFFTKLD